ncbi:hypothetical protein K1719_021530 [Acacia pycnantha]|nr:hypothetical protein K1719_021530 [Acacia pycnantha]
MSSQVASQIPVIDLFFNENLKPGTEIWLTASQLVQGALEVNGCFFVMSNKVSMEICNPVFALSKELFDLPLDTKKKRLAISLIIVTLEEILEFLYTKPSESTWTAPPTRKRFKSLEVKLKTGEWITIDPSPSLFIILAGDAFKVWSNGRITACEHKVLIREEKERYSIGLSSYNNKMVETQEELIDEDHPRLYKAFYHYEFVAFRN